ncbi:hypothetical protein MLD38_022875 [Melastoma candidum]|uniref:Uncharacterized protein n=1 Tax=Melastoma candidum TaxID=119954 RepID=A0ACB9QTW3_9MYRT|nr:hypothetical protein MLD38_022875 [Melastoma candidum]
MDTLPSNPALLRPPRVSSLSSPTCALPLTTLPCYNGNLRSRSVARHAAPPDVASSDRPKGSSAGFRQSKSYLPSQVAAEVRATGDSLEASLGRGAVAHAPASAAKTAGADRRKDVATRVHHSKSYLARQAAVDEVQVSTDLLASLERCVLFWEEGRGLDFLEGVTFQFAFQVLCCCDWRECFAVDFLGDLS